MMGQMAARLALQNTYKYSNLDIRTRFVPKLIERDSCNKR
jgi:DNA-binding LacI/PurR family transcriptional regulator